MNLILAAWNDNPKIGEYHALRRKYLSLKLRLTERKLFYLGLPEVTLSIQNGKDF